MGCYIGLDLGGTNIKSGVVDGEARVLAKASCPTHADRGAEAVIQSLAGAARDIAQQAGMKLSDVEAVGVGSPGIIDFAQGVVVGSPNLPGFVRLPLRDRLRAVIDRPVVIENDANAAAMGEFWAGAGQDPSIRHLVMFTLGTGVGGGIILDGHVVHGALGFAAELGHMILVPGGRPCGCGQRGCLEAYASANSVVRMTVEALAAGQKSSLSGGAGAPTSRQIFDAAAAGDAVANRVIDEAAQRLGQACITISRVVDPQMIVFAGGMALAGDFLFNKVRSAIAQMNWKLDQFQAQVVPAKLGNDAGLIGAAAVAWDAARVQ